MSTPIDEFLGELRLGRQLTNIAQIAAGGIAILVGLLILLSGNILVLVGTRAPLVGLVVTVVLGLTLWNAVELLGGSGERGGTYILVHETLGGWIAFLTGWSILAGSAALTVALVRAATQQLLNVIPLNQASPSLITIGLLILLTLIQLLQVLPRRIQLRSVVILLLGLLGLLLLNALPQFNLQVFRLAPAFDLDIFNQSVAWMSVAYIAFESLLLSRRQIRTPSNLLPRSILATLILGGLIFILVLFILAGIKASAEISGIVPLADLLTVGFFPNWVVTPVAILGLILAANGCMMTAARQIHSLSFEGAFPRGLRRVVGPFPMPIALFGVLILVQVPLTLWAPTDWMVYLSAGMFLGVMTILNVAAIYSHSTEPERRRPHVVPFAPLIPALAIVINLALINALPATALWSFGAWLLFGGAFYLVYARYHEVEAQAGETVFGRVQPEVRKESSYRILVPIGPNHERHLVLRMAALLAHQLNGEVIPLQIIAVPDPLAIEEGRRTARERDALFQWSMSMGNDLGIPIYPITRLARNVPEGIIDTVAEEGCDLVLMSWTAKGDSQEPRIGSVLSSVAREVSSDVAVVAYHPGSQQARKHEDGGGTSGNGGVLEEQSVESGLDFHPVRLLVPTAGGPHAPLAIQLALLLARESQATVTAVNVASPDADEDEIAEGQRRIDATIAAMRKQAANLPQSSDGGETLEQIKIEGRVIQSQNVVSGIAEAGDEYDLVMLGASEESLIDQFLFGNIPEQVAQECRSPVVIVKHYRGLPRLWLTRAWNAVYEALPTLNRDEQIEVYREVHRGARPDVDFFVMIGLSTLIATFGLLQGSSAVIIGAMLVAPLFSPLIALSLSITQGNVRLFRLALESSLKGIALTVGLAFLLAAIAPYKTLTPEITSRSLPNLFDLAVALASGAAGAYAMARKDVATALPGVAIAAALVPPLGVIGIGLAMGSLSIAGGGGLLFATNLIAIALAGSFTFLLLGFRPGAHVAREAQLRRGLVTTIVLFVLITIPLGIFFVQTVHTFGIKQAIQNTLNQDLKGVSNLTLVNPDLIEFETQGKSLVVTVPVYTQGSVSDALVKKLSDDLSKAVNQPVIVRLVTYPVIESTP